MKKPENVIWLILMMIFCFSCKPSLITRSPDQKNSIGLELDKNGTLFYSVNAYETRVIEKSRMGMEITDSTFNFNSGLSFVGSEESSINEKYTLPTGKTSTYVNKDNESVFTFRNKFNKFLKVVCRAYDDGVAFRYVVERKDSIVIRKENTRFSIPSNTQSWIMDYTPNGENFYPARLLDTIAIKPLSYPALMQIDQKIWMLLTEACVYDQPATHIKKTGRGNELEIELPEEQYSVPSRWESPWRTFILGTKLATIVESVMVENLNPPSVISDQSWIKPGVAVFPWWGNYMANSYIDTLKMYVDLAAEMNWKWIEFDVSLVGSPFHTSKLWESTGWLPDFTAYAESKGINVYGWDELNVLKTPEGRDHVYGRYCALGIKGIKIDFLDSDQQYVMQFRRDALKDAAAKKLMVSFHGETVPRGQRRTFPNTITLEGVHGAEYYTFKGIKAPDPEHNCTLPFTRNVIGSMDYTPVTFTIRPENPRISTYTHELALSVIFESGWMVMADRPKAYLNSPAKEFLQKLVSTWDETRFIDGFPGEYVCMARRKGDKWFLAGINAGRERTIKIPLNFIGKGTYPIKIYEDKQGDSMNGVNIREEKVTSETELLVKMMANGGFTTIIE